MRIDKTINKMEMTSSDIELLTTLVQSATNKVVNKLIFGLRDNVSAITFLECMEALKNMY